MNLARLLACLAPITLLWAATTAAHHNSGAVFDLEQEILLEGVVSRYEWRNPHVYVFVETRDETGDSAEWRIEAGPVALMRRLGWSQDSLMAGDPVTINANPSRSSGRTSAFLRTIETPSRELPIFRGEQARTALETNDADAFRAPLDLTGTWVTLLDVDSIGVYEEPDPETLTEAGTASLESFDEATMHPALQCIPYSPPASMLIADVKSIELSGDDLLIRGEFDGSERIVHLGSEPEAGQRVHGVSVGRREARTLFIETDRFTEHRMGNGFGLASSTQKRLTEALELNAEGTSLTYRFTLTDPVYLAVPISGEVQWVYRPDLAYEGLPCDPENSRSFLDD